MKRILESYLGMLIFLACMAFGIILYYHFHRVEDSCIEVLYWFSLSFISAFIFYLVTDYFPTRNKRHAESYLALNIIGELEKLNNGLLWDLGIHNLIFTIEDLTKKDIPSKLAKRCLQLKITDKPEPDLQFKEKIFNGSEDWVEYFVRFKEKEDEYYKELRSTTDLHPTVKNYIDLSGGMIAFRMMVSNYQSSKEMESFKSDKYPEYLRYMSSQTLIIYSHIADIYNLRNVYKSSLNLI